ncbi:MAG: hypothetical protein Ct9H300mP4_14480 [Gammaproteobacteria bacterium]|nr:MAG: hypothetical protein Ct9H300mP4_14480 [Gammaproteobacteria bacterium]
MPENVVTLKRELFLEKPTLDYKKVVEDEMIVCENAKNLI